MSRIGDHVIELEEKGKVSYDEEFNQYVKAIENDPEYTKRIVDEAEKRDACKYSR